MGRGLELTKRERLLRLRLRRALFTMLLMVGVAVMLYPFCMRAYFSYRSVQLAESYMQAMAERPNEELDAAWDAACEYNARHGVNNIVDPFGEEGLASHPDSEYAALLDPLGDGTMGYLDIPRIDQRLNIYHGTGDKALERGVGHLQGTSLPVGGESTRCVLSAHRGLPAAKLFTDLDQLAEGDMVYLHILDRILAYRVDDIQVVLPTEVKALDIAPGEDLLTLVTCTPYAVNTHRLLVTGHAVPYLAEEDQTANHALLVRARLVLLVAVVVICLTLAFMAASQVVQIRREQTRPQGRHARHDG